MSSADESEGILSTSTNGVIAAAVSGFARPVTLLSHPFIEELAWLYDIVTDSLPGISPFIVMNM